VGVQAEEQERRGSAAKVVHLDDVAPAKNARAGPGAGRPAFRPRDRTGAYGCSRIATGPRAPFLNRHRPRSQSPRRKKQAEGAAAKVAKEEQKRREQEQKDALDKAIKADWGKVSELLGYVNRQLLGTPSCSRSNSARRPISQE